MCGCSMAIFSSVGGSAGGCAVYEGGAMVSASTGVEEVACCDILNRESYGRNVC